MPSISQQPMQFKPQLKQNNSPKSIENEFKAQFGKTFLEAAAMAVSESSASEQQKMDDRKYTYTSEKKFKDEEDERRELLGQIRMLGIKMVNTDDTEDPVV
ncbi:MAG: hypothetical protein ABIH39_04010 [Candidatus Margulisiibacteriota bacterium]